MTGEGGASVDLYWLPLGVGGHFVRLNGRVFEAVVARLEQRPPRDLYHSALVVGVPEGVFTIEMAWPIPDGLATDVAADRDYLWVATDRGLVRFRLDAIRP